LELKEEETGQLATFAKDLIPLESGSQREYFATFGDLFVFILRLLEYQEQEEPDGNTDYMESLHSSPSLTSYVDELRSETYGLSSTVFDEGNEERLFDLECLLVNIVMALLQIENVFETTLEYTTFRNPMILFFVLQSINPTDGLFKADSVISKLASKVIYGSRLFLLGSVWTKEVKHSQDPGSIFKVAEYYQTNLRWVTVTDGKNYFTEVARMRRYLLKILKNRASENRSIIDLGTDTYLVYEKKYTFLGLCDLHQRLEKQLLTLLFDQLILLPKRALPRIDLKDMEDNSTISTEGYYLADNLSFRSIKDWMEQHLVNSTSSIYRSLIKKTETNGTRRWNATFITEFLQARQTFIKLFLTAAHLASGSPLRGTEWEHTSYRNIRGTDSNIRDVIWDRNQGLIRITTQWHKSRNITRQSRPNVRFLPPTLSYMLIYYILYTLPVYYYLSLEYLEEETISPFLFEINGSRIESPILSRTLYIESGAIFRNGLTLNPYRHLVNHILLEKIGELAIDFLDSTTENIESAPEQSDPIIDEMANRSTKTGRLHYSLLANQPGGGIRQKYIRTVEFTRQYRALFKLDKLDPAFTTFEVDLEENEPTVLTAQSARALLYQPVEDIVSNVDINDQLKRFLRDRDAQFRDSFQYEAVLAIFESITFLTYINKTGSGKSLLYLLPAFSRYQDMINIVMTPRVSLAADLLKRAQERKVRVLRFEDLVTEIGEQHTYPSANLIVASIESIRNSAFMEYVVQLQSSHRPIRIHLDEAHTLILEKGFRWVMKYVNNLLQFKVPIVFISATLPVPLLKLVEDEFLLPTGVNRIIRANTMRENIEYRIDNIEDDVISVESIFDIIEVFRRRGLCPTAKAVIFVTNTVTGKHFSEKMSLPFYHAKDPEKEATLQSFLSNDISLVLFATSALSLGVDFAIIGFTLHIPPHRGGITEYIQGSSRIRKDGLSIILQSKRMESTKSSIRAKYLSIDLSRITTMKEFETVDRLIFQKLLNEDRCLRQVICHFLDNIDIHDCISYNSSSASKVKLCGVCARQQEILERQAAREEAQVREINTGLANFEGIVENFAQSQCLWCVLVGPISHISKSSTITCTTSKNYRQFSTKLEALKSRFSGRLNLARGSCCYTCLLPARVCSRLKTAADRQSDDDCVYPDIIKWLIVTLEAQIEKHGPWPILNEMNIDYHELQPSREDPTGILAYCRRPIILFTTDAIEANRILNEINIVKIVKTRELISLEREEQKKRRRESREIERANQRTRTEP
jgi:superfamily II DNA helicase RecQ